ncbi:MAG: type III pantothenate kinase [Brevinematales bacterium]|nr:type III pantothenate kinase [Brevinematales bacterium]
MLLTIDIGNTNITYGVFDGGGEVIQYANSKTDKQMTTDDLAVHFFRLLDLWGIGKSGITGVIVSSVVPRLDYPFQHMFGKYMNIAPVFIDRALIPVRIEYDNPDEIGADRIVNAYAGICMYPGKNLIIVDFGTATTFDVVSADNTYIGGLIVPGILTSLSAMEEKASKLPHIDLSITPKLIGKNTVDGIRSGLLNGSGAMMDEVNRRIKAEMGWKDCVIIATGGLSELIQQSSTSINIIDKHLTLKGLYYIWKLKNA